MPTVQNFALEIDELTPSVLEGLHKLTGDDKNLREKLTVALMQVRSLIRAASNIIKDAEGSVEIEFEMLFALTMCDVSVKRNGTFTYTDALNVSDEGVAEHAGYIAFKLAEGIHQVSTDELHTQH